MEKEININQSQINQMRELINGKHYFNFITFNPRFSFEENGEIHYGQNKILPPFIIRQTDENFELQCGQEGNEQITSSLKTTFIELTKRIDIL